MFVYIVDNVNSNTNKSFDENDDGGNNKQCDESPSSKERKTEMNPSSKKSAFYSLPFLSFSLSCSFFSSLGVCRSSTIKSSSLLLFFLYTRHFTAYIYAPAFIIIQPFNRRISCSLFLHTFNHYRQEKENEKERKKRKNIGKKLRVRAISSKNVVTVVCSQVTMDCQEKPESSKKKTRKRKRRRRRKGLISYLRK